MSGKKEIYFRSMVAGLNIINAYNKQDKFEKYRFYTSFGTIIGKPAELFDIEIKNPEAIAEEIATAVGEKLKNGESVDALSIGNNVYLERVKKMYDKEQNDLSDAVAIALKDVVIIDHQGQTTSTNAFMLYFDQIIGFTADAPE